MPNGTKPPDKPTQVQIRVDLNKAPTVGCPICGCQIFATNVAMYKKLSAIQVGKPMLARVELCICQECNAVMQPVGNELKLIEAVPKGKAEDET